jgi:hypothetical protein
MGGQSSGGTQRTEPPKYQLPYLQHGVQQARQLYDSGQPTVAGQNGATIDALQGIGNMARNGSPITRDAGTLASQTLQGGFLGSNPYLGQMNQFNSASNPHLDATFNQAALATQNQLASQFAGSGRNVDASEGLRAQQLGSLATNIYGGAYQQDQDRRLQALGMQAGGYDAERARQQQVLGMSPALGQAQYGDLDRLLNVGQMQEGYQQQQLDAPGNALDQYMGRVSGNMGTTIKTSQGGGFSGGGAMGGAMLGNMLFPGLGGIIGGGLLGGMF